MVFASMICALMPASLAPTAFEASDVAVKTGETLLFFANMSDGQVHVGQLTAH